MSSVEREWPRLPVSKIAGRKLALTGWTLCNGKSTGALARLTPDRETSLLEPLIE
jgi:hypothetical protein